MQKQGQSLSYLFIKFLSNFPLSFMIGMIVLSQSSESSACLIFPRRRY